MAYRNYSVANGFIVDELGNGDFKTIPAAINAATSGTTIFIRPGVYVGNIILQPGIHLAAYTGDSLNGNVIITGKCTFTLAGTVTISGIELKTNSDFFLAVTGSAVSVVNLVNCNINCINNTGISYSSSSSSSRINIFSGTGDLGTTGIGLYTMSSTGILTINDGTFTNSGGSTTASTNSAGIVTLQYCKLQSPLSNSSTGVFNSCNYNEIDTSAINTTCVTTAGSGTSGFNYSRFVAGTASSVSIGAGTVLNLQTPTIDSTNTNAVTGSGTYTISNANFTNTSHKVNVTTQNAGGSCYGLTQGTAPSVGFLGEQITSGFVSGTNLPNNTPENLASIALTAGVWDISGIASFIFTGTAGALILGVSANSGSFTGTNQGDTNIQNNLDNAVATTNAGVIPAVRVVLSSSATYYLVGEAAFSTGACSGNGRISAVRVG